MDELSKTNWKCDWSISGEDAHEYWKEYGNPGVEQPPMLEPELAEEITIALMFLHCALTQLNVDEGTSFNIREAFYNFGRAADLLDLR